MNAGGAFGGAKGYQPKPPEKGVFPLDHFGECKQAGSYTLVLLVLARFSNSEHVMSLRGLSVLIRLKRSICSA